ncbi:MAG: Coenzyme F420 hydrogenase/dehydrogenase, beta subunit C-terminal domain [Candidatus Bathyarchaeia archaeon]|jgi:coenzyme F420 hydrogenase subunit beta
MVETEVQEEKLFEQQKNVFSAKTPIQGQDGGVVTQLLINGLKENRFDVAIVVNRTQGYNAQAVATENPEEVLAARGTKYFKINVLAKLRDLIEQGKRKIAITCTPCQAAATRKIFQSLKRQFPDIEISIIGLFCFEAFDVTKLREEVKRVLNVDLDKAERTQIRKGKFYVLVDGREVSCRIRELEEAVDTGCRFCEDFTARFADVSVGSVGSPQGFSTVIVRSVKGEELVNGLDAERAEVDKQEIVKLSKFKAERAQKKQF